MAKMKHSSTSLGRKKKSQANLKPTNNWAAPEEEDQTEHWVEILKSCYLSPRVSSATPRRPMT